MHFKTNLSGVFPVNTYHALKSVFQKHDLTKHTKLQLKDNKAIQTPLPRRATTALLLWCGFVFRLFGGLLC